MSACFFCDGTGRVCFTCGAAVRDELEGCVVCAGATEVVDCDACAEERKLEKEVQPL